MAADVLLMLLALLLLVLASRGGGDCDAQCPHDLKFIHGEGHVKDWHMTKAGPVGAYGNCCSELDTWEANAYATASTTHASDTTGPLKRTIDKQCGEPTPDCKYCNLEGCPCCKRYNGVCGKDGCDFNSYRMGDEILLGKGSGYSADTFKPISVVTQSITADGTGIGDLKEMSRRYVQDGKAIQNSVISPDMIASLPAGASADSITDETCQAAKRTFDNPDDFTNEGDLAGMGKAMKQGMVLDLSLWDDMFTKMVWLDLEAPSKVHAKNFPGTRRGPCSMQAGNPNMPRNQSSNCKVHRTNITVGETYRWTSLDGTAKQSRMGEILRWNPLGSAVDSTGVSISVDGEVSNSHPLTRMIDSIKNRAQQQEVPASTLFAERKRTGAFAIFPSSS